MYASICRVYVGLTLEVRKLVINISYLDNGA